MGECVHVAGVINFLRLAEQAGWRTVFLGPAVPPEAIIAAAKRENADLVGVSYRLTPETGERLLGEFAEAADELYRQGVRFAFGGTPPVADRAKALGFFEAVFDGTEPSDSILAYLRGQKYGAASEADFPQTTVARILWKQPYPILRHHFGQPTMEVTLAGIEEIAEAGALDVISLGIDQDAQANFFHPERQNLRQKGAGGVPVRTAEDYRALYNASRRGNYPLLRTYSGTDDFIKLAEMYRETINIAWCAIPIFWFNRMDGRGPWGLEESIHKHQQVMAWYGEHDIPVELNEPHHWGMRDAPDVIFVVSAYLSAYQAKRFGVRDYIAQLMFNSPPGTSDAIDLAKMQAWLTLIQPLQEDDFRIWRQTRTGLLSYPLQDDAARAHLAASIYVQMALKPHIVHIVGHTEAHHAATAGDIVQASQMARQAIDNALKGQPDMLQDPAIQARVEFLTQEARTTIEAIQNLAPASTADPLADPATLTKAVSTGILDAPHLKNNPFARGTIQTRIVNGACVAVDSEGNPVSESTRINQLFMEEV
jgi:methylmalonyl-CoA mutase cobalamin-binding subunit